MPAPSSRAAEVLDRLAREQQRRPLFHRSATDESADRPGSDGAVPDSAVPNDAVPRRSGLAGAGWDDPGSDAFGSWRTSWRPPRGRRLVVAVLGVVAVAVLAVAFLVDRRAPAVEERLPLASEERPEAPPDAPPGSSGAPGTSAAEGTAPSEPGTAGSVGGAVFVHIGGAVTRPGVVELPNGSRVVDAVRAAGGLVPDADPDRVNLAAELVDGQRIVVPRIGQPVPAEVVPTGPLDETGTPGDTPAGTGTGALVDLNAATAEQLEDLPGIGPATAAAILQHREREGPFRSVDGLIDVRGIGEAKLEALRDLVTVGAG